MSKGPRNITNDYTPDGRKLSSRHVMSFPKDKEENSFVPF